ncbi:MAG: L-aspartate oxidase [Candidatus Peregrinibacteria bacterium]
MRTNFLIIGSGISGLNFALHAAKKGKVVIVTKKKLIDSNTNFAQGGIAAVLDKTDDIQQHIKDTLKAGSYHNNRKAVKFMVKNSAEAIYRLIELGVHFEREKGELKLTNEGGHSKRRIAYVGDYTGQEIERILVKRVKEHLNITILEDTFALDLITKNKICFGAQTIQNNKSLTILSDQTILATGGIGQLFENTTNPEIATGDGIAMAVRAGCKVQDLEFIQFHPSALAKKISPRFLISETVRGEGAKLLNSKGEYFMAKRHPQKDLAPRSVVAKEVYQELKEGPVFLDIRHKKADYLKKRFPQIYAKLKTFKIAMAKDLIPITPAAHYLCGGIKTDLNGRTNVKNLFAFGEVTCTGVHGADRLASNSLLEALVFSNQIAKQLKPQKSKSPTTKSLNLTPLNSKQTHLSTQLKQKIQAIMWNYAGIVRDRKAIKTIAIPLMKQILKKLPKTTNIQIAEVRNMAETSLLILKAAQKRQKTLGCHYSLT